MPIYEYTCRACGRDFEELVRGARDEAELACPACGSGDLARCLSACAVQVSGGAGPGAMASSSAASCGSGGSGGGGGFR